MTNQAWAPTYPTPPAEPMPELDIPGPAHQRRWTILLRWLLLIPQYFAMFLLGIVTFVMVVVGWFAALVIGRLPNSISSFLAGYLVYETRVYAYSMLLVDQYPPFRFNAPDHPVQIEVQPGKLNRLAVLFRIILLIPAAIVEGVVTSGWYAISFIIWLIALILGRMPNSLFEATAATARYAMRLNAYVMMLTPAYPKRLFGDDTIPSEQAPTGTRPLRLSTAARVLVVLFIVLGIGSYIFSGFGTSSGSSNADDNSSRHVHALLVNGSGEQGR